MRMVFCVALINATAFVTRPAGTTLAVLFIGGGPLQPGQMLKGGPFPLNLALPLPGIDVAGHNKWIIEQIKKDPDSRVNRLITPDCVADDIIRDLTENDQVIGLKPYRFFSVTGEIAQCRIHEFLTHPQMEVAQRPLHQGEPVWIADGGAWRDDADGIPWPQRPGSDELRVAGHWQTKAGQTPDSPKPLRRPLPVTRRAGRSSSAAA